MMVDSMAHLIIKVTHITDTRYSKFQSVYLTGQAISKSEKPIPETYQSVHNDVVLLQRWSRAAARGFDPPLRSQSSNDVSFALDRKS